MIHDPLPIASCESSDTGRYVVHYRGVPVRFVNNVCGRVWSVVHISEATRFETRDDAQVAIVDWGLLGRSDFTIDPSPTSRVSTE
jgi:hypothetical protein